MLLYQLINNNIRAIVCPKKKLVRIIAGKKRKAVLLKTYRFKQTVPMVTKKVSVTKYDFGAWSEIKNSNGMEDEPQNLQTWREWQCSNPLFKDYMFHAAHKNASDLCINCPVWESNKNQK